MRFARKRYNGAPKRKQSRSTGAPTTFLKRLSTFDEDASPNSKLPFGKYGGRPLSSVPRDYLLWLLEQPWFQQGPHYDKVAAFISSHKKDHRR